MDESKILKGLPVVQRDIGEHYMENNRSIRKTMEKVLERQLTKKESDNLRQYAFELAIVQVGTMYKKDLELDNLKEEIDKNE